VALAAGTCLLLSGCLTVEKTSLDIRLDSDQAGSYQAEFYNIQSDATRAEDQESDFQDLLKMTRGTDYLLDGVQEGRYIRTRQVKVEKGIVVGREEGLFRVSKSGEFPPLVREPDGSLHVKLEKDEKLASTNGGWVADSGFVRWPPGSRRLLLSTRHTDFKPTRDFVARLQRANPGR
jgi:hypothetical protein